MQLTVDARVWKTGIGTYTLNLLSGIRQVEPSVSVTAIVRAEAESAISPLCHKTIVVDVPIYTAKEQLRIKAAARGCDLLHVPHYNVPVLHKGPLVVTIHDLTHITNPSFGKTTKALVYARPMLQIAARKASHIITVSEYSKREIVDRLGASADKISVIYNGVGPQFQPGNQDESRARVQTVLGIDRPYLLCVGNLKPHKNLGTLARAFAALRSKRQRQFDGLLLLVGDDRKHRQGILEECSRLGLDGALRHVPWLPDELLVHVYRAADLTVMPSSSEGFGFPVLESMACGTPVACSSATSLPEVGGDAAVYFDPSSEEEMAAMIERALDSPNLRDELREKGLKQAAKFSWAESARKHVEAYRGILAT